MKIEHAFTVGAPRENVAAFLLNAEAVQRCVPGVEEVRTTGEDSYEVVLGMQLGPLKPTFKGSVEVDRRGAPDELAATAKGRDRGTGSAAEAQIKATLLDHEGATRVEVEGEVVVRGRLGQFGTGVIRSTAQEVLRQFGRCVNASFGGEEEWTEGTGMARTVVQGVTDYLRSRGRSPRGNDS